MRHQNTKLKGDFNMDDEAKHELIIWFDHEKTDINELSRFVYSTLINNTSQRVGFSSEGSLILSILGTLESVDKSHSEIIEFVKRTQWSFFRVKDTAGDEIRR